MSMKVKVFGERNTGTRATIAMIRAAHGVDVFTHAPLPPEQEAHFAVWADRVETAYAGPWRRVYREAVRDMKARAFGAVGAWKHGCARFDTEYQTLDISVLFLVRNPYSWILSLHRSPYHHQSPKAADLDIFLRRPWKTVGRDGTDSLLATPLALWNEKLASYRAFAAAAAHAGVKSTTMRFEDFVAQPTRALNAALGGLGHRTSALRTVAPTKPMGKKARERRYYYGRELWRDELICKDVAFINRSIDWSVAEHFGYERLEPDDFATEHKHRLHGKTGAATAA